MCCIDVSCIGSSTFVRVCACVCVPVCLQIEITNDVQFLLPLMVGVMCAKWTGDYLTHPLYHALLELKCIPFLDEEPVIVHAADESHHQHAHGKRYTAQPPSLNPIISVLSYTIC